MSEKGAANATEEDTLCAVCFNGDVDPTNEIVFCDRCDVAVHQACYGIERVPSGNWFCDRCQKAPQVQGCCLCPETGGALKRTDTGKWAHVTCGLWIPGPSFPSEKDMTVLCNIDEIDSARYRLTCTICSRKNYPCVQCAAHSCRQSFHPMCAALHHTRMVVCEDSKGVHRLLFCSKHEEADIEAVTGEPADVIVSNFVRDRRPAVAAAPAAATGEGAPAEPPRASPEIPSGNRAPRAMPTRTSARLDVQDPGPDAHEPTPPEADEADEDNDDSEAGFWRRVEREHFRPLTESDVSAIRLYDHCMFTEDPAFAVPPCGLRTDGAPPSAGADVPSSLEDDRIRALLCPQPRSGHLLAASHAQPMAISLTPAREARQSGNGALDQSVLVSYVDTSSMVATAEPSTADGFVGALLAHKTAPTAGSAPIEEGVLYLQIVGTTAQKDAFCEVNFGPAEAPSTSAIKTEAGPVSAELKLLGYVLTSRSSDDVSAALAFRAARSHGAACSELRGHGGAGACADGAQGADQGEDHCITARALDSFLAPHALRLRACARRRTTRRGGASTSSCSPRTSSAPRRRRPTGNGP
jgi:hypothetical protein